MGNNLGCKPFTPKVHIPSIIKHPVYYTTLVIVRIKIFVILKKDLYSINFFLNVAQHLTPQYFPWNPLINPCSLKAPKQWINAQHQQVTDHQFIWFLGAGKFMVYSEYLLENSNKQMARCYLCFLKVSAKCRIDWKTHKRQIQMKEYKGWTLCPKCHSQHIHFLTKCNSSLSTKVTLKLAKLWGNGWQCKSVGQKSWC